MGNFSFTVNFLLRTDLCPFLVNGDKGRYGYFGQIGNVLYFMVKRTVILSDFKRRGRPLDLAHDYCWKPTGRR